MYKFSDAVRECLVKYGWSEDREVDISDLQQLYENNGRILSHEVMMFLKSFRDLKIDSWRYGYYVFQSSTSLWSIEDDEKEFQEKPLYHVGHGGSTEELMINNRGSIFKGLDSWWVCFGETTVDSIENLFREKFIYRVHKLSSQNRMHDLLNNIRGIQLEDFVQKTPLPILSLDNFQLLSVFKGKKANKMATWMTAILANYEITGEFLFGMSVGNAPPAIIKVDLSDDYCWVMPLLKLQNNRIEIHFIKPDNSLYLRFARSGNGKNLDAYLNQI